jgi:succinoglycan biosynthesis transport protein ExoP
MPPINEEKIPEKSLRDIYYIVFRQKWKAIIFFLVVFITVTVGTFLMPEIYRSEAKLMVRLGRESVSLDPTATTGPFISVGQNRENEIKSELEILNSQDLVEKVVDAIGPAPLINDPEDQKGKSSAGSVPGAIEGVIQNLRSALQYAVWPVTGLFRQLSDRDKAVLTVMKNLEIEALKNSNTISISFEARSQKLAKEVIDGLINFYLEKHITVHRTAGSYAFFNEQSDQFQNTLAQTEEDLRKLKDKTGIASLDEQRRALVKRIGDLQQETGGTEASLAASSAKVQALQKIAAELPPTHVTQETTGIGNYGAELMRSRLYELQLKEQDLLSKYNGDSNPVREIRRQIAEAQALLDKEDPTRTQVAKGLNESYKQAQLALIAEKATLSYLQAKASKQKALLASARNELKNINDSEVQLAQVERELSLQKDNYRKYNEKLEQARIDQALEMGKISNISVVQPATYPIKPVRPRKMLNLALGLFLGIFGALGLAFFSEYMDHTFKKPEDVEERLQLPMLASIPVMLNLQRLSKERIADDSILNEIFPSGDQKRLDMPSQESKGYYEALRGRMLISGNGALQQPRLIALTSARSGEGVSTVAFHLAAALAMQGDGRVLYVNSRQMNESAKLSSLLTEIRIDEEGNVKTSKPSYSGNLDTPVNFSRLTESKTFKDLLDVWKRTYSFTVFDMPPVLEENSAVRLAGLLDGVILVVEAERARWEVVQRAKGLLEQAKANMLGVVLNKRRYYVPEWVYRTL